MKNQLNLQTAKYNDLLKELVRLEIKVQSPTKAQAIQLLEEAYSKKEEKQPRVTKKGKIRELLQQGLSKAEVMQQVGAAYSQVHVVSKELGLTTVPKARRTADNVLEDFPHIATIVKNDSKKAAKIRELNAAGVSRYDIHLVLETPYSFVKSTLERKS